MTNPNDSLFSFLLKVTLIGLSDETELEFVSISCMGLLASCVRLL